MVIIYNPNNGALISDKFRSEQLTLAKPLEPNSIQYCDPALAQALVANYPFLQIVTSEQAQQIKQAQERPVDEFKCDQCEASFTVKIALLGHQRSHKSEEKLDLPVVETVKVDPKVTVVPTEEIPDDLKGIDWYGEGVKEDHE